MLRLLLVRHAAASERDRTRWPDDRERPLTAEGMRGFRKGARGLRRLAGPVAHVLSSPLVRARQTAELLTREAGWPDAEIEESLAPGRSAAEVLTAVRSRRVQALAVVGHEPQLSALLALCVAGPDASIVSALKKGGAACLTWDGPVRPGRARLTWLLGPKPLRALRKAL